MKKENVYFLVKPNTFWRYGEVDINGNYPEYLLGNFDVNREYNFFMFEGKCNNDYYPDTVKEIFTGKKFNLTIYEDDMATIESDELGLYFNGARNIKDIEIVPSKASGLLKNMKNDKGLISEYTKEVEKAFLVSKYYANERERTINGPHKSLIKSILRLSKKNNK